MVEKCLVDSLVATTAKLKLKEKMEKASGLTCSTQNKNPV